MTGARTDWRETNFMQRKQRFLGKNTYLVYSKPFGAGTVSLGPNDNGNTDLHMYTVIVK